MAIIFNNPVLLEPLCSRKLRLYLHVDPRIVMSDARAISFSGDVLKFIDPLASPKTIEEELNRLSPTTSPTFSLLRTLVIFTWAVQLTEHVNCSAAMRNVKKRLYDNFNIPSVHGDLSEPDKQLCLESGIVPQNGKFVRTFPINL